MRKYLFIAIAHIFVLHAYTQTRFVGDAVQLNKAFKLRKLPSVRVWDKNGKEGKLGDYIQRNQLNGGKPLYIAVMGLYGDFKVEELKAITNSSIPDEYNVLVLCVSTDKDFATPGMGKFDSQPAFSKCMIVKTSFEELASFYTNTYPLSVFVDKGGNVLPYTTGSIPALAQVKKILSMIETGKADLNKTWYTRERVIVEPNDPSAYFYYLTSAEGSKYTETYGTKEGILSVTGYVYHEKKYYYEGKIESKTPTGQSQFSGEFKSGVPISTVKLWYADGKVRANLPVNGTAKAFDENGKLSMEGEMQNGLGNGLFTYYTNGEKTQEYNFIKGEMIGIQKEYNKGELKKEFYMSSSFEDLGDLKDGMQNIKINGQWGYVDRLGKQVIAPQYKYAGAFEAGVASVIKNDVSTKINTKGVEVSSDEAKKIRSKWTTEVKVFSTRNEIVNYLKDALVGNLYFKKYYHEPGISFRDKAIQKFDLGGTSYIPLVDIIEVRLGYPTDLKEWGYTINIIGKDSSGISALRSISNTEASFLLKKEVTLRQAYQIQENLKQLARLSGADLVMDKMPYYTQKEIIDLVSKAVGGGRGLKIGYNKILSDIQITQDRIFWSHQSSSSKYNETSSGFNWNDLEEILIGRDDESELVTLTLEFNKKFNRVRVNNNKTTEDKNSRAQLFVPVDQYKKVIGMLYQLIKYDDLFF
jgi:antitoxin component YwqK of YwqJK toxin-antitoxin module